MKAGDAIDETGLLLREGGAFYLRGNSGGRYLLALQRVPIDEVQKQVRVVGTYAGNDLIDVEGIRLAETDPSPPRD